MGLPGKAEFTISCCFSDQVVKIPMRGVNKSLNVAASLGIVLFKVIERVSF